MEGSMFFPKNMEIEDFAASAFIKFYIWFLLSILIFHIFHRLKNRKLIHKVILLFLLGIFCISIHYITGNLIWNYYLSGPDELFIKLENAMNRFFSNMPMSSLIYGAILLIMITIDLNQKYQAQFINSLELETKLSKSQLSNLKMQLHPHFMFNALNTISMLVRKKNNEQAVDMISGMSDLLRTTLSREETQLVNLKYELELLKKYLDIERLRFKEKLTIDFEINPETLKLQVPNLILQPIVENAFKHGFSENFGNSSITIKSDIKDGKLLLSVLNTGPQLPPGWEISKQDGIGLRNTVSRLETLYGDEATFNIKNTEPKGVLAELQIPLNSELK